MRKAFDFEGPVFSFLSRLADLVWLNCLFLFCSIPIFTIGASITSMYYVTLKMARDEESYITRSFFKSFKQNFLQATGIWIILFIIGSIVVTDFRVVVNPDFSGVVVSETLRNIIFIGTMIVTLLLVFIFAYVFPILAKFENSVKNTIRNALLMSVRHLPYTFIMIALPIIPIVLMYYNTSMYLLFFIMFSVNAYISSKFLVKIFDNYIPKDLAEE